MALSFAVNTLKEEKDELQLELERHKYKLKHCEEKIAELREKEVAYSQMEKMSTAFIAALVELSGGTKDTPMIVPIDLVNHALLNLQLMSHHDETGNAWKMYCIEKK